MLLLLDDSEDTRLLEDEKDSSDDLETAVFDDVGDGGGRYDSAWGSGCFSSASCAAALSTIDADARLFFLSRLGIVGLESDQQG